MFYQQKKRKQEYENQEGKERDKRRKKDVMNDEEYYHTDFRKWDAKAVDAYPHEKNRQALLNWIDSYFVSEKNMREFNLNEFLDRLAEHYKMVKEYYTTKRLKHYSKEDAEIRANEVFSESLQNLIYYVMHPRDWTGLDEKQEAALKEKIIQPLLNHPLLFYIGLKKKIILWIDPILNTNSLATLARSGSFSQVKTLLDKIEVQYQAVYGSDAPKKLLELFQQVSNDNYSALNTAANAGKTEIVKFLINKAQEYAKYYRDEKKAKSEFMKFINQAENDEISSFNFAAASGQIAVVKLLMDKVKEVNANDKTNIIEFINQKNSKGFSPLNSASAGGHEAVVQYLIETAEELYGDDKDKFLAFIYHKNINDFTSLHSAAFLGQLGIVKLIVNKTREASGNDKNKIFDLLNKKNNKGFTALNAAVKEGNFEVVKYLLEMGVEIFGNDKNKFMAFITDKDSPILINAAKLGNVELVKLLLDAVKKICGNDHEKFIEFLNQKDKDGFTALNSAAISGNLSSVKLLVEAAEDAYQRLDKMPIFVDQYINSATSSGFVPVNSAAATLKKLRKNVDVYVKKGTDKMIERPSEKQRAKGEVELMSAHLRKRVCDSLEEIISFLKKKGADVNKENKFGFSAANQLQDRPPGKKELRNKGIQKEEWKPIWERTRK